MTDKLTVGIVGGGAVGLTYACFLADVADVLVNTRSQTQADNINTNGIRVTRAEKTDEIKNIKASANISDLKNCDAVIIAIKSYDTEGIAIELSQAIRPTTQVVSLQNGLEAFSTLNAKMSHPERVFAGVTYIGARRTDDHSISLGKYHRTVIDTKATTLIKALQATKYGAEASINIKQAVWDKMVLNTGQNALSAVTNLSARQMLKSDSCLEVASKLLDEFAQVAQAESLTFTGSLLEKLKDNWSGGDDFYPSMWQDLHAGNRTEIDAINGAISSLGRKHDIATPYNDMITSLIKALENDPQKPDK